MSSMEGELTCPICLQIYQDPVVMSCMHSYCRGCLKDLHVKSKESCGTHSSNTLTCPSCRAITSFGLEGVDGLPKNFTLASICRKFQETSRQPPDPPSDETRKQESSDERRMYCKACRVIVRSGGTSPTHRYHVTEDIEAELTKQQAKLSTCLQELEIGRARKEARLKAASVYYCNRQEQIQKREDAINSLAESIEERLRSRKKQVLEKIESLRTHNKATFETYQEQLQYYLNTVDSITAAAHTIDEQRPDGEEGQIGFLQVVDDVLIQAQRLDGMDDVTLCLGVACPTYGEEFAENLRADFRTLLGTSLDPTKIPSAPNNEETLTESIQVEVPTDEEVDSSESDTGSQHSMSAVAVEESIQVEVPTDEEVDSSESDTGSQHSMSAVAVEESIQVEVPTDEEVDSSESDTGSQHSMSAVAVEVVPGTQFEWDPDDCHSSLAISADCLLVTDERWKDEEIRGECANNSGNWRNVHGIASHIVLRGKNSYWEILVTYAILNHLDDDDLITDLGICKSGKEDVYSPLNENYYCLCCSLIKDPDSSSIVMEFWDGPKKTTWDTHEVEKRIKRRKRQQFRLGFYVDFQSKMFRIIDVNENSVLHTFEDMTLSSVTAVASIANADKVRTSLKLVANVRVSPSVLWKRW